MGKSGSKFDGDLQELDELEHGDRGPEDQVQPEPILGIRYSRNLFWESGTAGTYFGNLISKERFRMYSRNLFLESGTARTYLGIGYSQNLSWEAGTAGSYFGNWVQPESFLRIGHSRNLIIGVAYSQNIFWAWRTV